LLAAEPVMVRAGAVVALVVSYKEMFRLLMDQFILLL
jgi:hypothetical protein